MSELVQLLTRWLEVSDEETIGDVGRFARAPWVSVETELGLADLNADTRREAVAAFVEWARAEAEGAQLRVVENRRGRVNKVVFGAGPVQGWYCYLRRPIAQRLARR